MKIIRYLARSGIVNINHGLEFTVEMKDTDAMKTKRRLRTREELLALEDKYFPGVGNLLSLGAAHFRQTNRKNGVRARGSSAAHRRRKSVAG